MGNATLYILRYLVSLNTQSDEKSPKLREHEFDSLLCMLLLLVNDPFIFPQPVRIPCNMRCVSLGSCFQAVYKHLVSLSQILSLHKFFAEPKMIFNGQLFAGLFMSGLEPAETKRIYMTEAEKMFLTNMMEIRQNVMSSDDFIKAKEMTLQYISKGAFESHAIPAEELKLSANCAKSSEKYKKAKKESGKCEYLSLFLRTFAVYSMFFRRMQSIGFNRSLFAVLLAEVHVFY